jgi:3-oxoadipate enol-lactonase
MAVTQSSEFRTSDGCSISYTLRSASDSPHRIALAHSLGLDRSLWDPVAREIGDQASLLIYDCRGHGKSSRDTHIRFTPDLFARDLAELLDHTGWPTAVVAGCSMGGNVSQAFGRLYPARAAGLGLVDTSAFYGSPEIWQDRIQTSRTKGLASMIPMQIARWVSDEFAAASGELIARINAVFAANDLDCYAATCDYLSSLDQRPHLHTLTMPVTIIVGDEDPATPVSASETLHSGIPGSKLVILKGRHLTPLERPAEVAAALLELARRTSTLASASLPAAR